MEKHTNKRKIIRLERHGIPAAAKQMPVRRTLIPNQPYNTYMATHCLGDISSFGGFETLRIRHPT
jgi:hypothetical protein